LAIWSQVPARSWQLGLVNMEFDYAGDVRTVPQSRGMSRLLQTTAMIGGRPLCAARGHGRSGPGRLSRADFGDVWRTVRPNGLPTYDLNLGSVRSRRVCCSRWCVRGGDRRDQFCRPVRVRFRRTWGRGDQRGSLRLMNDQSRSQATGNADAMAQAAVRRISWMQRLRAVRQKGSFSLGRARRWLPPRGLVRTTVKRPRLQAKVPWSKIQFFFRV